MVVYSPVLRLDLRELTPPERHGRVFRRLGALSPGEAFLIVNDHDPRPLLYQLQFLHAGEFDWFPWEEGPEAWTIELVRRAGSGRRTVTDFMAADHDWLDTHFALACEAAEVGDWEAIARHVAVFAHGMKRHLHVEETMLIPAYKRLVGQPQNGTGSQMSFEHAQIQTLLADWLAEVPNRDPEGFQAQMEMLLSVLGPHNQREEQLLYPTIDRLLDPHEANRLVLAMQAA